MEEIKAIPTKYNNHLFRSRTEARWAVFFDVAKIQYYYEPEGIRIHDSINYLPDFYLPESKTWFEAKGVLDSVSTEKIEALIKYGGQPVVIGYSDMTFEACDRWEGEDGVFFERANKDESTLCRCNRCGHYYFMGWNGLWRCPCCGAHEGDHHFTSIINGDMANNRIMYAIKRAKQAQFENYEQK